MGERPTGLDGIVGADALAVVALCAASSSAGAATPFVSGAPGAAVLNGDEQHAQGSGLQAPVARSWRPVIPALTRSRCSSTALRAQAPGAGLAVLQPSDHRRKTPRPSQFAFSPPAALCWRPQNFGDNSVSLFEVSAGGVLTPVTGSPFALQAGATAARYPWRSAPTGHCSRPADKRQQRRIALPGERDGAPRRR